MSRFARLLAPAVVVAASVTATLTFAPTDAAAADAYVVRSGDSLFAIASRLDVSLADLLRANDLTVDSVILPGQRLAVPGRGGASGGAAGTYVVRAGDWLARIASRHGVSLPALLEANDLTVTSLILPGQRLVIPAGGTSGSGGGGGTSGGGGGSASSYVIQSGDWLARIASRHGVSLPALLEANDLTVTSLILPGQRLTIPAGGTGGSGGGGGTSGGGGSSASSYVIQAGDWLARIASRHGVSLPALLEANDLTATSLILPGQRLTIPAGGTGGSGGAAADVPTRGAIGRVLAYATAQVGKPWRFASRGPDAFDCSGLTTAAYAQAGVSLIQQSAYQARQGTAVDFWRQPILAGDLVFQDTNGDGVINHVGIALGNGTWVQARDRRSRVTIGRLPALSDIVAVRRMLT